MYMKFSTDVQDKYIVLALAEVNLNSIVAPALKSEFVRLATAEGAKKSLILDLSPVQFVDSSGLSAILTAERLWKNAGFSFILTGVNSGSVRKLIEISRLDNILTIVPTIEESVDLVFMEQLERELEADGSTDEL